MALRISSRVGATSGLVAVLVWLAFYAIAAASLPGYDILRNQVSDLGHPSSPGAWAFDLGCILAGLLFLPFALSIPDALAGRIANVGGGILAVAVLFLVLVGVFPEQSPYSLHFLVSTGFFLSLLVSAGLLIYPLHETAAFGRLSAYLAAATAAACVGTIVTLAAPIVEHLTVFIALLFTARVAGGLWAMAGSPVPEGRRP